MINFIFLKNRLNFGNVQGAGGISNELGQTNSARLKRKNLAQRFLEQSIEDEEEAKRLQRKNKRKLKAEEKDNEISNQKQKNNNKEIDEGTTAGLQEMFDEEKASKRDLRQQRRKRNENGIEEETTAGLQEMFSEMQDSLQTSLEKVDNQIEKTDELINKVNQVYDQNDQSQQAFRQDGNVQNPEINQNETEKILDYDEKLTKKLIKKGAFKEILDPEETRKRTKKIDDLDESLIKAEIKDGKLNLKVSDNVETDFNKVLNTKEGKNGFTVSDISGGKNSISVNKSKDGITNFELNVPEKNDKKPILNLPNGAKIELGDDDGKPKLFINDEKDLEKLQKKYNGKIKVDGIKFEDIDVVVVGKDNELGIKAGFEQDKNQVVKSPKQEAGVTQTEKKPFNKVQATQAGPNPTNQTLSKFESSSSAKNDKSENISKSEISSWKKGEMTKRIINGNPIQTPEMAKSDNAPKNIHQNIIKSVKEIGQDAFADLVEAQKASILQDIKERKQEIDKKTSLER